MGDLYIRGTRIKSKKELEEEKKEEKPSVFKNLLGFLSKKRDPAIRGAARTSDELLEKEEEARKKREEERKKRGY